MPRVIQLTREAYPERPAFDTALSRAVLHRVADGSEVETLRIYRPADLVAFGPLDVVAPGFQRAVAAARSGGFEAILRLAGGRAAVFHDQTIAFAWTIPDEAPRAGIEARYHETAEIMAEAFQDLGVDARIGAVPGEYCPGAYSVNARGRTKLMGVGQRLIAQASHVGGVVVVDGSSRVRDILLPVYRALELGWDPATAGSVADEIRGATYDAVDKAIVAAFRKRYTVEEAQLSQETIALAETFEAEHLAPAGVEAQAALARQLEANLLHWRPRPRVEGW